MDNKKPSLLIWFRRDLRLQDNAALAAALNEGYRILPVFILDKKGEGNWAPGGASRVWLHAALKDLDQRLRSYGLQLILRKGDTTKNLIQLLKESKASGVYWNRCYEPSTVSRDSEIKAELRNKDFVAKSFCSALLFEPQELSNRQGKPFQVFTPFWKTAVQKEISEPVEVDLKKVRILESFPRSDTLEDFDLLPKLGWGNKLLQHWEVGEEGASQRLQRFINEAVEAYDKDRDAPSLEGTSRLSPYLHWGQIGPRQIWKQVEASGLAGTKGGGVFLKEVGWREFAHHVLYHFPQTPELPLRSDFEDFPWQEDEDVYGKWCRGETGYPIIDAGMRQLWEEGWMHNRVRMVVASLLVKHLLQSWQKGAAWFWNTLVDADLASNTLGWQWSGGCGADAAPYFRVFNPILQGKKFDSKGDYVRRYVPELSGLPDSLLHTPWEADGSTLSRAKVELGKTYPYPIIDHAKGRDRALAAFKKVKK